MRDAPLPRRPRARATDARLRAAGRRAFAQKGLAGANLTEDILAPAGVSVGSFYHRYRDKTELLLAILREHAELFRARLQEVHLPGAGRTPVDIARAAFGLMLEMAERHEDLLRIQLRERSSDDLRVRRFLREDRERFVAGLAASYRQIADGGELPLDADLAAELVVALSLGAVAQYLETPRARRPAARARWLDGLVRFTLGGLPALAASAEPPRAPTPDPHREEPPA